MVKGVETLNEHQLIKEYFSDIGSGFLDERNISISVGDDAAVLVSPTGKDTVISVDTSIEGVHFLKSMHASDIAYRAVSIALSDLAACGALPAWFTLALSLNQLETKWLSDFRIGLEDISNELKIPLIGGDTTKGSISITVQVGGYVDRGKALTRSGAKVGDSIYVTGCIGEASSELESLREELSETPPQAISSNSNRYTRPKIRFGVATKLVGIASSAIDISDGLFQDLNHISKSSKVGAKVFLDKVPTFLNASLSLEDFNRGDDYEVLFTSSQLNKDKITKISKDEDIIISEIGVIEKGNEVEIISSEGNSLEVSSGYQHFEKRLEL